MIRHFFAVRQRKIKEETLVERQIGIEARIEALVAYLAGELIGGEHAGGPTKHVSRKLIEHDDGCQGAAWSIAPGVSIASDDVFVVA